MECPGPSSCKIVAKKIRADKILRFRLFTFLCGWVDRDDRNAIIASDAKQLFDAGFSSIAILTNRKKHAEHIAEKVKGLGAPVFTCIGSIEKYTLKLFSEYGGMLIGTESLLAEGVDIPSLEVLQLASPGGGKSKVTQRVGRLMRGGGMKYLIDYIDPDGYSKGLWFARYNTYKKMRLVFKKFKDLDL